MINRPIVVPDNVLGDYSEFRDIKILPNGTAYVLRYNQGTATGAYVYKTTISNLLSNNPESWELVHGDMASYGYFNAIDAEYYTKRVWVQDGSTIYVYVDGEDVASQTFQINETNNSIHKLQTTIYRQKC